MSFDSAAPGTDARAWDPVVSAAPLLELSPPPRRVLVVAAHPDDEALGAGGLLARFGGTDVGVTILCVTDGGASHPGSSVIGDDLVAIRSAELRAARDVLAPRAELVQWEIPDGSVREHRTEVRCALDALIDGLDPELVVAPWPGDGHRDHRVVGELCEELATAHGIRIVGYPIWFWHWGDPDAALGPMEHLAAIDLAPAERERKARAVAVYRSQTEPADAAVLRPDFLRHFVRDREVVVVPSTGDGVARHFERLHRRDDDPWAVETSWYERRKASLLLATIPTERVGAVLEIGASTGAVTARLAERSASVLAVDLSPSAVASNRGRAAGLSNVWVEIADVRDGLPPGRFDLVVLSEVGYYLTPDELETLIGRMRDVLTEGGAVLACHWSGRADDMPQSGADVHRRLRAEFVETVRHDDAEFSIGLYGIGP